MRFTPIFGALTVLWLAGPSSAQMTEPTQPQAQSPGGMMMMCAAPATTGQGEGQDKTSKPMQMGMMCPCCQAMMKKKGMMQQKPQMPGMEGQK